MFYYDAEELPKVRLIGKVKYQQPWKHFYRCIDEYLVYVIRDGNMFLCEDGVRYHLKKNDFLILEPGRRHEGYEAAACDYYIGKDDRHGGGGNGYVAQRQILCQRCLLGQGCDALGIFLYSGDGCGSGAAASKGGQYPAGGAGALCGRERWKKSLCMGG